MSEADPCRLFVAVALPAAVKAELNRVQGEMRAVLPPQSASWTKPENMHLTLRFLGKVDGGRVPALRAALSDGVAGFGELDLVCERLGCFPDLRFPRVVWAWVHDAEEKLTALAQQVNNAVAPFAEQPAENSFTGHITLARPKQVRRPEAEKLSAFVKGAVNRQFGSWRVCEVELICSELSPAGSRYTTLAKASLLKP